MRNEYRINGAVTEIIVRHKGDSYVTLIDTLDLPILLEYGGTWHMDNNGYVVNRSSKGLHRVIMGVTDSRKMVDHMSGQALDNRKQNLRIVTNAQNQQNRKGAASNSSTGVRGVSFRYGKYYPRLNIDGVDRWLPACNTLAEADVMASRARAAYFPYSSDTIKYPDIKPDEITFAADTKSIAPRKSVS